MTFKMIRGKNCDPLRYKEFHTTTQPVFYRQQKQLEPRSYNDEGRSEWRLQPEPLVQLFLDYKYHGEGAISFTRFQLLLTFHFMYGHMVNGVMFSCTFLACGPVALHKYIWNEWIHCKLFILQSSFLSPILILY